MIGIVYRNDDKQIIAIISDVVEYDETGITGKGASAKGIDLAQASFCIVESTVLSEGDTLGDFVDSRHLLPETPDHKLKRLESELETASQERAEANLSIIELWEALINGGVT